MLVVTTYAYRMERVERLLRMIDQPGEPKKFRFRQLRYTMAKTLTDKVKAMAEQMLESVTVTVAESEGAYRRAARQPGENDAAYRTRVNAPAHGAAAAAGRLASATDGLARPDGRAGGQAERLP